jgi:dipeptidyl aminopeptidase/acylaminoacyl peptidase
MRVFAALFFCSIAAVAQSPTIEHLFRRPLLWGTSPDQVTWSKKGHTLVFLWNADGRRFRDLYSYSPDEQRLTRLTDLEKQEDEINISEEEKDDRLKPYVMPPAGLGSFDLSPDGWRVAFSYKGDLYIAETDGKARPLRLTRTKELETSPQFSPDSKKLASLRGGQLIVQDLTNGQIWQATNVEGADLEGYRWSPDGKTFVCLTKKGARQLPLPNYSGRFVAARNFVRTVAGDEPGDFGIFLVPSEGGKQDTIEIGTPVGKGSLRMPEWAPDSKKLVALYNSPTWKKKQVMILDAHTRKANTVAEESDDRWVDYGFAGWSPDSKTVLFTSEKDGWAHLYVVPSEGGEPKQLTHGEWEVHRESFSEDPQWIGDSIYFASTEGDTAQRHTYRIRPDGSGKEKLSQKEGLNIAHVSEDGKYIAWKLADPRNPFDLWVNDKRVTQSPRPEFYTHQWPEIKYVSYPSRGDKKPVAARLMLPPDYRIADRSQKPHPAVVYIHGAGYATSVLKQWGSYQDYRFAYNTFLASKGYVVLEMDYRGSTGYGRDWRSGVYLHMGGPDLDDVLGGVDYLKSLGNIDMNKLGIWGVSYGGFMTDMAMFLSPGTFKAGSAWAAVNDWENYNAGYTAQRLNTPQSNPEAYRRSSPIHFSNNLKDHLLIIHGIVDDNVLFQDAVQLSEKLIHEGKDFSQAFYPQESHGFVRDETWIDALRRTTEWFERYLR